MSNETAEDMLMARSGTPDFLLGQVKLSLSGILLGKVKISPPLEIHR